MSPAMRASQTCSTEPARSIMWWSPRRNCAPVRVNAVSPGIIDTPIRAAMPEEARRDMLAKTAAALPVGRVGAGEDIARQILAFMTIGFATGSIVYLDGGALIT